MFLLNLNWFYCLCLFCLWFAADAVDVVVTGSEHFSCSSTYWESNDLIWTTRSVNVEYWIAINGNSRSSIFIKKKKNTNKTVSRLKERRSREWSPQAFQVPTCDHESNTQAVYLLPIYRLPLSMINQFHDQKDVLLTTNGFHSARLFSTLCRLI